MKAIEPKEGQHSDDGKVYTFPQPNLFSIKKLHQEFIDCMEKSLESTGLVLSTHGTQLKWVDDDMNVFDLTRIKNISFHLELVKIK